MWFVFFGHNLQITTCTLHSLYSRQITFTAWPIYVLTKVENGGQDDDQDGGRSTFVVNFTELKIPPLYSLPTET